MSSEDAVIGHYARPELLQAIEAAVHKLGKSPATVTADDLAPADEFHIGGRVATERLLDQLDFPPSAHLLDIGCGIGGPARCAAGLVGRVTGVDLTPEYVDTGDAINRWLGLDDRIDLQVGSALDLEFGDGTFDGGYLIHVGMNIEDKDRLLAEIARVLRPGARFGIYDIMRTADGELAHPVPWATDHATSHVDGVDRYRRAAEAAGLTVVGEHNRGDEANRFFDRLAEQSAKTGPGPMGLHLVMGPTVGTKVANMVANVRGGLIAPVELIVQRPAVD